MNGERLTINGETTDNSSNIIEAHPVMIAIFGTTKIELPLVLKAQAIGMKDVTPWRCICVDSMAYEDVVTRLTQNCWTTNQVMETIPRSHYFQLPNPFNEDFSFDDPINKDWLSTIFDPILRRIAKRPDGPGCAGTPALGRARVEGNEQALSTFFERHLYELTQLKTETLAIKKGVMAFVVTTYRGGTGTGATMPATALLKQAMDGGFIHLHAVMPDAYGGDPRAAANAFAATVENQGYHRYNCGVPLKGGRTLKAPLDSATYMFGSNGSVTLHPRDILMQEAAILLSYLKAPTQSAITARLVDLTDVTPYDLDDRPMHVRLETAISIQTMHPGVQDYLVLEWVRQELEETAVRFEEWCKSSKLFPQEESRKNAAFESLLKEGDLAINNLLNRLDPSPAPPNALRSFFEHANGMIGSMKAGEIKQNMANLPAQVRDAFVRYEDGWKKGMQTLAQKLPDEIATLVMSRFAGAKYLALSTLEKIRFYLADSVKDLGKEAEIAKKNREAAGAQLGQALKEVQEAKGLFSIIKSDEVTRDAAQKACGVALAAAMERVKQQRFESLIQALAGEMTFSDDTGKAIPIPSITAALRNIQTGKIAEIRERYTSQIQGITNRLTELGQGIEKRSQVFQRSIVYDGLSREKLNELVLEFRKRIPHAPPVEKFLEGKQDLQGTLKELLPHLPSYVDRNLSLTEILANNSEKRKLVLHLLRNTKPFTPINRVVEEQQNLRNRRDTMMILEIPGGRDASLADLMLNEGIVQDRNQIVDSGSDEIRLYYLRDGLPYGAIQPLLERYKNTYERYMETPTAVTPYTFADAHLLPGLEPPKVNLRIHTELLLYTAKVILPDRVKTKPSGGFIFSYQEETGYQFLSSKEEQFQDFNSMTGWLAKRPQIRNILEDELKSNLDSNPSAYKETLVETWRQAVGTEKDRLQHVLFSLKIDPSKVEPLPIHNKRSASPRKARNVKARSV